MGKLKIAVLYGGTSAERAVSLNSGEAVANGLVSAGYDVDKIDTQTPYLQTLLAGRYDCAFIALHGRGGEDGVIQGLLESIGLPYTGSGVAASALAMNKHWSKLVMDDAGIPVAPSVTLAPGQSLDVEAVVETLGLPIFVKPACEGSSVGMTKVTDASQLEAAVVLAQEYDQLVLMEAFLAGREYSVPILADKALPVIGLQAATDFYDYAAKYERDDTQYLLPSGLSDAQEAQAQALAEAAARVHGCKGWCRVDVMSDGADKLYVLELNTSPGMTDHSLVPMAGEAVGLSFAQLVDRIVQEALANK